MHQPSKASQTLTPIDPQSSALEVFMEVRRRLKATGIPSKQELADKTLAYSKSLVHTGKFPERYLQNFKVYHQYLYLGLSLDFRTLPFSVFKGIVEMHLKNPKELTKSKIKSLKRPLSLWYNGKSQKSLKVVQSEYVTACKKLLVPKPQRIIVDLRY